VYVRGRCRLGCNEIRKGCAAANAVQDKLILAARRSVAVGGMRTAVPAFASGQRELDPERYPAGSPGQMFRACLATRAHAVHQSIRPDYCLLLACHLLRRTRAEQ
jgi:hypothetical protein